MAHIERLPSGNWRAVVRLKNAPTRTATRETKAALLAWVSETEAEIRNNRHQQFPAETILSAFDRYEAEVSSKKRGERWERVRLGLFRRHFAALPRHGDVTEVPFYTIDSPVMADWRDMRLQSVSKGSVTREISLLRNVFAVARDEWHWTDKSPWQGVKAPGDNPPRKRRVAWQEIRAICRHLGYVTGVVPSTKSQETAYAFLISLRTGLRASEVLRLTEEHVDKKARVLRGLQRKMFYKYGTLEDVPVSRAAIRLLRPLLGLGGELFTVDDGVRCALFGKACKACGIKGLQFRDGRASALTRMSKKVNVFQLSKISDHRDIKTLNEHYYRMSPEDIAAKL